MEDKKDPAVSFFTSQTILYFLLIIIIGNLFIIDVSLFGSKSSKTKSSKDTIKETNRKTRNTENTDIPTPTEIPATPTVKIKTSSPPAVNLTTAKEYFVPLGTGSSNASDWTDVAGAQAYINSSLYNSIKSVTFEASLYTPTGNQTAYARLFNVTDGHPVWNSDVVIDGGTPQLKISGNITLSPGSKLYQVQIKTQLKARTDLENARVHIITN